MLPVGRLVLMRSVEKRDLIQATSWVLIPAVVGPILGPPIGGFIVTYLNWRWIFYINVPIGILGVILVSLFIANTRGEVPEKTDYAGIFLSSLSLGLLLFGFELTSHDGMLRLALSLLALGALLGVFYVRHARRTQDPILDISLMKIPTFGTSVIAGAITRVCQGAHPYLLPLMMQLGFGLSAAQSGLMTLATALGSIIAKPIAPSLLRRFGFRDTLAINGFFASAGYAVCGLFRPGWPLPLMFVIMVMSGFFMSIQFTGYNTIAYDEIEPDAHGLGHQLLHHLPAADAVDGDLRGRRGACRARWCCAAIICRSLRISPPPSGPWRWSRSAPPSGTGASRHDAGHEISGHTPRTWPARQVIKEPRGLNTIRSSHAEDLQDRGRNHGQPAGLWRHADHRPGRVGSAPRHGRSDPRSEAPAGAGHQFHRYRRFLWPRCFRAADPRGAASL